MEVLLHIILAILGLLGGMVERHYSDDAVKERDNDERDRELAEQNSTAISKRLSDGIRRVRLRNKKKRAARRASKV